MVITLTEKTVKEKLAEIYKVEVSDIFIEHTSELVGYGMAEHSQPVINVKISIPSDRVQIM